MKTYVKNAQIILNIFRKMKYMHKERNNKILNARIRDD
jgi:hypothetical protein